MKVLFFYIPLVILNLFLQSCKSVKLDKLIDYRTKTNLICPDIVYYNILYDSASYNQNDLKFLTSGSSFIKFKKQIDSLIRFHSESSFNEIPFYFNKDLYLTTNVRINPAKVGGWITEEQRSYWITRYRKEEIQSIQIENFKLKENQTMMILNFWFLKVNEGRVYVTGAINGILRMDMAIISGNEVKFYNRYIFNSFRENTSKLYKNQDLLPWFKDRHVYGLVAKVFDELKNCSK